MLELGGEFGKSSARGNRWHQKSSQRSHCVMLSFDSADAIMPAPKDEGICHRSASFPKNKMSTYICKCLILWKFILCVYITSFKGMNEYYKF